MELKEYSIIRRFREVQTNMGSMPIEDYREIVASQSGFDGYDEMYHQGYRIGNGYDKDRVFYIVKIGRNRFVEVLCVTDYVHQEQTAYMMRNCIFGITKEGDRFFYHDILSLEQEKSLTNMVIEAYNKEFQYKPFS